MVFERALEFALRWEGGFVDHPDDPGGATNYGVTQSTYDEWRSRLFLPPQSVQRISSREVRDIYFERYWRSLPLIDTLCYPLQLALFDTAVNFGVWGAITFLQETLGLKVDGIAGRDTHMAIALHNTRETAGKVAELRRAYRYKRIEENPSQAAFLKGWLNRDAALLKAIEGEAIAMRVIVRQNTWFKRSTAQSSELPQDEKFAVTAGTVYEIGSLADADINHVRFSLKEGGLGSKNYNTWHGFKAHIEVSGTLPSNNPNDKAHARWDY
jgi:lysozyme family protein